MKVAFVIKLWCQLLMRIFHPLSNTILTFGGNVWKYLKMYRLDFVKFLQCRVENHFSLFLHFILFIPSLLFIWIYIMLKKDLIILLLFFLILRYLNLARFSKATEQLEKQLYLDLDIAIKYTKTTFNTHFYVRALIFDQNRGRPTSIKTSFNQTHYFQTKQLKPNN